MYTAKSFVAAKSLAEADELLKKSKKNRLLAGGMWLRLGKGSYHTLVDLSQLGLNQIQFTEKATEIGAFTTLRQIEQNQSIQHLYASCLPECLNHIVGVQFRNLATIGGNVFCKHGFSDIIPALLVLQCQLEFYHQGQINLADYLQQEHVSDILLKLILSKDIEACCFTSYKQTATDLSILNFAAASHQKQIYLAIGARPRVAKLWHQTLTWQQLAQLTLADVEQIVQDFDFGSNMRASQAYRQAIAPPLLYELLLNLKEKLGVDER